MLRRVLGLECRRSVPVGTLVEMRGAVLQVRQCYLTVGVVGMPLPGHTLPWMDGLPEEIQILPATSLWQPLAARLEKLSQTKGATADWIDAGFDRD